MNSAAPRVSVTMWQHGKAIKAAAPGSRITLAVKVRHTHPGHLHYRWTSDTPGLVAADAPSVATSGAIGSTSKVTGALTPAGFPSELVCVATAVYWPHASVGLALADSQPPASSTSAFAVATITPCASGPL